MTVTTTCVNAQGYPKETFPTEQSAKRALARKRRLRNRRLRNRRWPHIYHCPCGGYHLTAAVR